MTSNMTATNRLADQLTVRPVGLLSQTQYAACVHSWIAEIMIIYVETCYPAISLCAPFRLITLFPGILWRSLTTSTRLLSPVPQLATAHVRKLTSLESFPHKGRGPFVRRFSTESGSSRASPPRASSIIPSTPDLSRSNPWVWFKKAGAPRLKSWRSMN